VRVHRPADKAGPHAWLDNVAAVVQPALFEARPHHLLTALAAAVPVIVTPGCGLVPQPGLTIVPDDDPQALRDALRRVLWRR
jgi:glycosyltransferase involved in cell wall biosynthesis